MLIGFDCPQRNCILKLVKVYQRCFYNTVHTGSNWDKLAHYSNYLCILQQAVFLVKSLHEKNIIVCSLWEFEAKKCLIVAGFDFKIPVPILLCIERKYYYLGSILIQKVSIDHLIMYGHIKLKATETGRIGGSKNKLSFKFHGSIVQNCDVSNATRLPSQHHWIRSTIIRMTSFQ